MSKQFIDGGPLEVRYDPPFADLHGLRVGRPSHRDTWRVRAQHGSAVTPWPQEWLLIEWPEDKDEPLKYWLSTMPAETAITALVDTAKLRWRIVPEARLRHDERDFQDLKQEIGLDHYEGRGWRGFHHHAALSIAAYGFLVAERSPIPPSAPVIRALGGKVGIKAEGYRPRRRPCALSDTRRTRYPRSEP